MMKREWLRDLRLASPKKEERTVEFVAAGVGVNPQTVYFWEQGVQEVSIENRRKLIALFGPEVADQFAEEDKAQAQPGKEGRAA